ncbi:MAG: hypothetical protein E7171_02815 [Firmicutes bacterium]|nr:hypothetical protein [Bacillota bacterium]
MKKILFIILSLFMLIGNVNAESKVTSFYTVTNKCVVVKDNKVVVPVTVRVDNDKLKLSKLMKEINIGYITNYEDVLKSNIYNVDNDNVDIFIDYKRNSVGKSLVYFSLVEDMELKRHDTLVNFNIGIEILKDTTINKLDIFGNEVIIADEVTCEKINGYKVTEVERIVDLREVDHTEYIKNLIKNIVIVVLSIISIICIILLIRKKK